MTEEISKECMEIERKVKQLTQQINREGVEFFVKRDFRDDVVLYYKTPNYSEPQRCKTAHNYRDMGLLLDGLTYYPDLLERLNHDDKLKTKEKEKEIHGEEQKTEE